MKRLGITLFNWILFVAIVVLSFRLVLLIQRSTKFDNDERENVITGPAPAEVQAVKASPPEVQAVKAAPPEVQAVKAAPPEVQAVKVAPPEVQAVKAAPPEIQAVKAAPPSVKAAPPEVQAVKAAPPEVQAVKVAPPEIQAVKGALKPAFSTAYPHFIYDRSVIILNTTPVFSSSEAATKCQSENLGDLLIINSSAQFEALHQEYKKWCQSMTPGVPLLEMYVKKVDIHEGKFHFTVGDNGKECAIATSWDKSNNRFDHSGDILWWTSKACGLRDGKRIFLCEKKL